MPPNTPGLPLAVFPRHIHFVPISPFIQSTRLTTLPMFNLFLEQEAHVLEILFH